VRAIREGVDPQGKTLVIMPNDRRHVMSYDDMQVIVAYLRLLPPIDRQTPKRSLSVMADVLIGANQFPLSAQPPITEPVVAPPAGTIDYGENITEAYGCRDCRGKDLRVSAEGGGPNWVGAVSGWSEDQLLQVFKGGIDPSGNEISDNMPWKDYNLELSDSDLHYLSQYLHSLTGIASTN